MASLKRLHPTRGPGGGQNSLDAMVAALRAENSDGSGHVEGNQVTGVPHEDRQAVTHGTRVSVTIAARIAATTPSTARGTMPIQYLGIGSSR